MKKLHYILFALPFLILSSCTKEIKVDLKKESKTLLVVDGGVFHTDDKDLEGMQTIKLTHSYPFFDKPDDITVSGAQVVVTEVETGKTFEFNESSSEKGVYKTDRLAPVLGYNYKINIKATLDEQEQEWEGEDIVTTNAPQVDSLFLLPTDSSNFDEFFIAMISQEDLDADDYYFTQTFVNGELIKEGIGGAGREYYFSLHKDDYRIVVFDSTRNYHISPGQIVNGETFDLDEIQELLPANVRVVQHTISQKSYIILNNIYNNSTAGSDTPAAKITTNLANKTFPERFPLGIFLAGSKEQKIVDISGVN
jgi:hypothetical protein